MKYIVTHPGQAHRDDFISCCVLLAVEGMAKIFRRQPTEEEMLDNDVFVVDVGGKYESGLMNFDHHQPEMTGEITCALSLVLQACGFYEAAKAVSAWVELTEVVDCHGPKAAADRLGMAVPAFFELQSPVEAQMLRLFAEDPNAIAPLMQRLGRQWVNYWDSARTRLDDLPQLVSVATIRGLDRMAVEVPRDDNPTLALEQYIGDLNVAVTVTADDHGTKDDPAEGWSLYRRNDHPAVDFRRIKDNPLVKFVHNNGFIAKTHACELAATDWLIRDAIGDKFRLRVETDDDFSIRLDGCVYSTYAFEFDIYDLKQLDRIEFLGPYGAPRTERTKCHEVEEALKSVIENPYEEIDTTGGNRGLEWTIVYRHEEACASAT